MTWITGIGIVSSIGLDVESNFKSLLDKKDGIGYTQYIDTYHKNILPVGEVKLSNQELISLLVLKGNGIYSRTELLAIKASKEAYVDANLEEITDRTRIAVFQVLV